MGSPFGDHFNAGIPMKYFSALFSFAFVFAMVFILAGWVLMPILPPYPDHEVRVFEGEYWKNNWVGYLLGTILGVLSAHSALKRATKKERKIEDDKPRASRTKKLLVVLGGFFAVILLVAGIAAAIYFPHAMKLDREAIAYIQDTMPKIVGHWNSKELLDRATPQLDSTMKSHGGPERHFEMFRKLGPLKHLNAPTGGVGTTVYPGQGAATLGEYSAKAEFENGTATILIQLLRMNGQWMINGLRVNSDAFLPSKD
jgi:succinate dehydrogenase hydrophobic anchor subunit